MAAAAAADVGATLKRFSSITSSFSSALSERSRSMAALRAQRRRGNAHHALICCSESSGSEVLAHRGSLAVPHMRTVWPSG